MSFLTSPAGRGRETGVGVCAAGVTLTGRHREWGPKAKCPALTSINEIKIRHDRKKHCSLIGEAEERAEKEMEEC